MAKGVPSGQRNIAAGDRSSISDLPGGALEGDAPESARVADEARFLDSIVENIPYMIFVKDAEELRFVRLNEAGERLLGYRREAMIGRNDYDFFPREQADFFTAKDREVLANGGEVDISEEPVHTRSEGTRTLRTKKIPILDDDGNPLYLLGISEDVTAKRARERELSRLTGDLAQRTAELENAVGELESLSYSIAHDLRSPLRALDGYSHLLLDRHVSDFDAEDRHALERIREASHRMAALIDGLLALSRIARADLKPEPVDLGRLADDAVATLARAEPGRRVKLELGSDLATEGDRQLLGQLIERLIDNAWKFTRERDVATIALDSLETTDNGRVFVLRDNGIGFDPRFAGQLFNPFQGLRPCDAAGGLGMGLAAAERVVRRHGGDLWARGTPGEGASFFFTLGHHCASNRSEP
jgi:PAS domain S-box-containing protein